LDQGIIDAPDKYGYTPLMTASKIIIYLSS